VPSSEKAERPGAVQLALATAGKSRRKRALYFI
jgi:hypothetical protein